MKYFKTTLVIAVPVFLNFCHVDRKLEIPQETSKTVECQTNQYGITNLCDDEKMYLDWAKEQKKYKSLKDLTREELQRLTRETLDVDKTSSLFYLKAAEEPINKKFISYLDRKEKEIEKKRPDFSKKNILLAMVPGMFYKDNPTVGADGKALRDIATGLGLKEDVIPVDQTGTVEENAKVICEYVKSRTDVNGIIFASVSKGSGDLKKAIQLCGEEDYFKKAKGWYNIGGLNKGTLLVDGIEGNWRYRWEARSYFFWKGYNYEGFLSMGAGPGKPLDFELKVPKHLLLINVIAVPQFRQVTKRARPFYEHLIQYGPNDGMTLLADSYVEGAITYPSFRNDHYFQWPIYENRLRAFFTYIVETQFPK